MKRQRHDHDLAKKLYQRPPHLEEAADLFEQRKRDKARWVEMPIGCLTQEALPHYDGCSTKLSHHVARVPNGWVVTSMLNGQLSSVFVPEKLP
jgi:hypothetical protein